MYNCQRQDYIVTTLYKEIPMNSINISQKAKNKHLNFSHYEFIINSLIQFNASHPGKRNIGKTQFIKELASTVGTTVSNVSGV